MQVTATNEDGLKRELKITIPASDLAAKMAARLDELKNQVKLKGFRPGKVPVDHLRRLYGQSVMAEVVQESVTIRQPEGDHGSQGTARRSSPISSFPEDKAEIEQVMEGKADLAYTVAFEVLPDVQITDLTTIKVERLSADVGEEDIVKGIDNLADSSIAYTPTADRKADTGDQVKDRFRRQDRRRALRGRQGRGSGRSSSAAAASFPASRMASRAAPPATSARSRRPSPRPIRSRRWPARKPSSR